MSTRKEELLFLLREIKSNLISMQTIEQKNTFFAAWRQLLHANFYQLCWLFIVLQIFRCGQGLPSRTRME